MSGLKQTFITKLTDVNSTAQEPLGTLRYENNYVYKYVEIKNTTATVAGALGSPVGYFALTGYVSNRVVVDQSDSDNPPICAGILQGDIVGTLGVSEFGWIQIKGAATLGIAVTNGTAGAPIYLLGGATDKTMQRANEVDAAGVYKQVAGFSRNATTGIIINCPE